MTDRTLIVADTARKVALIEALAYMNGLEIDEIARGRGVFSANYPTMWEDLRRWLEEHSE